MSSSDEGDLTADEIVFIEADVPDIATLLAGLAPGAAAFVLSPTGDGVQEIADILEQSDLTDLTSISVVAHGAAGEVQLGSTILDDSDLPSEAAALAQIGAALAPGGELALYACDAASGAQGQTFIADLSASAGGVEVRASTHLVGAADNGGSWTLDASTAPDAPAAAAPFTARALANYQGELAVPLNGVNYVADVNGSFATADSLSQLAPLHVGAVAVVADFGIDALNDTVYSNDILGGYTESDDEIGATISEAAGLGLGVMVRPLIDFLPANFITDPGGANSLNGGYYASEWRTYFNPGAAGSAGANAFFASYQNMIVGQARLAQANGAAIFCIGTELDQITGPAYESYWSAIVAAVRGVFSGKLTYAADWDDADSPWQYGGTGLSAGTGDIATQVSFWNQLDFVGVDEYAPISDLANPTLAQLVAGWTQTPTDPTTYSVTGDQSLIAYYQGVAAAIGKPLLFTEIGYANSSDADSSPATPGYDENGDADGAVADPTLQANLYAAFYQAWAQAGNGSLAGYYWWNWEPGGAGVSPFSAQGDAAALAAISGDALASGSATRPVVTSITRVGANPTDAADDAFTVTFSEAVTGVGADDFLVTATGASLTTAGIVSITGSGTTYVVDIGDVTGAGTLGLDFNANATNITDAEGQSAIAPYTAGQTYTIAPPKPAAPCDFSGDGLSDILLRDDSTGETYLWDMNGANVVSGAPTSTQVGSNWRIEAVGDFNVDGAADLLWEYDNMANAADPLNGVSYITLQNGPAAISGSGVVEQLSTNWQVAGVGDFTGSGVSDILYRYENASNASDPLNGETYIDMMNGAQINWTTSGFTSAQETNLNWSVVGVADFTGSGEADVLWRYDDAANSADPLNGALYEWGMNGTTVASAGLISAQPGSADWTVVGTGDFNGDGTADILLRYEDSTHSADPLNGLTYVDFMNGTTVVGGAPTSWRIDNSWQVAGIGDYNGDGKADILWRQASTGATYFWEMNGASVVSGALTSQQTGLGWTVQNGVLIQG